MIHDLKCLPEYFERLLDGSKTFEVRRNDRGIQLGDELLIREWEPGTTYVGCPVHATEAAVPGRVRAVHMPGRRPR